MSDISELITLGIGTPSDIPHLTLFGLSPSGPLAPGLLYNFDVEVTTSWGDTVHATTGLAASVSTSDAFAAGVNVTGGLSVEVKVQT